MSGNEYDERPGGRIRIGDQERDDAVQRLGAHYEAGRLTAEEHAERVGEALQAKTEADLAALFADLPGEGRPSDGPAAAGEEQAWAGPWGAGGPPWAQRGPFGRIPFPVLIALAVIGVLASIACTVGAGHPPVLPLLLILAGIFIVRRRRRERRA